MGEHPLVAYVHDTFGRPFGDLLLVGYGAGRAERQASFKFTAPRPGWEASPWVVDVTARSLPKGREPLVLAAVLKLLLLRIRLDDAWSASHGLEFSLAGLLDEVCGDGTSMSADEADEVLDNYARLSYRLHGPEPPGGESTPGVRAESWRTLVSSYTTIKYWDEGTGRHRRLVNRVELDREFVGGLQRGEITFAGMDLGRVQAGVLSDV